MKDVSFILQTYLFSNLKVPEMHLMLSMVYIIELYGVKG